MSENNTLKLPRRSFWISIVFLTTWYLALILLTGYLRVKGFVFVESFYIGLVVTMTTTVLLFLINPSRLWSKVGVWFLRIVMIFITMISIGMMFVAIHPTSLDKQNAERKRVVDLEKIHRLSEIGPYIPNQVTKKIGEIPPVMHITYEVAIKPENDKPILLDRYSTTSTLDMTEIMLQRSQSDVVDLGTYAAGVDNGQLWILKKSTNILSRYSGLYSTSSKVDDSRILSFLRFESIGDRYVLISPTYSIDPSVFKPQKFAIFDKTADTMKLFDLPIRCSDESYCVIRHVPEPIDDYIVINIAVSPQASICDKPHLTYFLDKRTSALRLINEFHPCTDTYTQYLGIYHNLAVIFSYSKSERVFLLKDPVTHQTTILTDPDSISKDVNEVLPIGPDGHLIGIKTGDAIDYFDLDTQRLTDEQPTQEMHSSNYSQYQYPVETIHSDVNSMRSITSVTIIKKALNAEKIERVMPQSKDQGDYQVITKSGDFVDLHMPQLIELFDKHTQVRTAVDGFSISTRLTNMHLLAGEKVLFETDTISEQGRKDLLIQYWVQDVVDNNKRVGMVDLSTGEVFLVDQNRTTEIVQLDIENQRLFTKSKNADGGYWYRVLDLKNNIPLASFSLGDWTYVDPTGQYGPNLMLPIHEDLGLDFQMSHCMNSRNVRTTCFVTPYKLDVVGESMICQKDQCSFHVRVEKGATVDKYPSEQSAIGKIVRISIDSNGNYQINENAETSKDQEVQNQIQK